MDSGAKLNRASTEPPKPKRDLYRLGGDYWNIDLAQHIYIKMFALYKLFSWWPGGKWL